MKFNRKKFFDGFRKAFGSLRQDHVVHLEFLLDKFEKSTWFSADVRRAAFALGNLYVETFIPKTKSRFAPVTEVGSKTYFNRYDIEHNPRKARELGNLTPGDGYKYRGRGFCQITGKTNYAKFDIADTPEKALEPDTAFHILERGIRYGIFTGRSLGTYLTVDKTDYVQARRVINGQDRAKEIAGYAKSFEKILIDSAADRSSGGTSTANDTPIQPVEIPSGPAEPPPNNEGSSLTIFDKADALGQKADGLSARAETVLDRVSSVSRSSLVMTVLKAIFGWLLMAWGVFKDNWIEMVIAGAIILAVIWYWNNAKKRASERTISLLE